MDNMNLMAKLSWKKHDSHRDILKEFYGLNKYLITEQLKDTLLDAIECMNYVIEQQKEVDKEVK